MEEIDTAKETNSANRAVWETNAKFWDDFMGDRSNSFHRDLVRPYTEEFLAVEPSDRVLDIACGNGNFTQRLVDMGADVVAFDFSPKMIELAKKRRSAILNRAAFSVCDATSYDDICALAQSQKFNKAVANMALMDISDIEPLFRALALMLTKGGVFVFSMHHPCFTYPKDNYFDAQIYKDIAIEGQPELQYYYHRSLQDIFNMAFNCGFALTNFREVPLQGSCEPIIMIVKLERQ